MSEADLIDHLWARRHELTPAEWQEAAPILLGYAAAAKAGRDDPEDDRLRHIIDRDRYIVAAVLGSIRRAIRGRDWLRGESRGPYEWDDDRFREEFRAAVEEIERAAEPLAIVGWDKSDCTRIEERVNVARAAAQLLLNLPPPSRPRVMIAADLGLPCPACERLPG